MFNKSVDEQRARYVQFTEKPYVLSEFTGGQPRFSSILEKREYEK